MESQVTYQVHRVSKEGIRRKENLVDASLVNAPLLKNESELKSYLGMINYYQKLASLHK